MVDIVYLLEVKVKNLILKKDDVIYFSANGWMYKHHRFDNHNMALMLIEILYEKNQINEATYKKIMNRNYKKHKIA